MSASTLERSPVREKLPPRKPPKRDPFFLPTLMVFTASLFFMILTATPDVSRVTVIVNIACTLAAMLVVRSMTTFMFNARAGLCATAMFGFSAPVIYVGGNTLDAPILLLLAGTLSLAVTYQSFWTAIPVGVLLGLAVVVRPGAWVFVGCILALTYTATVPGLWKRVAIIGVTANLVIIGQWLLLPPTSAIYQPIQERTLVESLSNPFVPESLTWIAPSQMWPMMIAASFGLIYLIHARQWHKVIFGTLLFVAALILPVTEILTDDTIGFRNHLAYSALFLAPLAGWGLARPWKLAIWGPPLTFILLITLMWGAFRAA